MKTFREFLELAEMQLDENLRRAEYLAQKGTPEERRERRKIMAANAKEAEQKASKNKVIQGIRSRRGEPEPKPTPPSVGGAPYTSSGEGLNPEGKKPRERKVTPYVPPPGTENLAADSLAARTEKPFGTVKPEHVPPAAPVKRKRG